MVAAPRCGCIHRSRIARGRVVGYEAMLVIDPSLDTDAKPLLSPSPAAGSKAYSNASTTLNMEQPTRPVARAKRFWVVVNSLIRYLLCGAAPLALPHA